MVPGPLPLGDSAALVVGTRTTPTIFLAAGSDVPVVLTPGGVVALHLPLGGFYFRPELAVNTNFAIGGEIGNLYTVAIGLGFGGTFDFRSPKPVAAPAAAPAPEPAPELAPAAPAPAATDPAAPG